MCFIFISSIQGQPETTQVCKRIDLEAKMNWDELKSEAMNNFKLVQKKGFLEEFDNAVIYYREVGYIHVTCHYSLGCPKGGKLPLINCHDL